MIGAMLRPANAAGVMETGFQPQHQPIAAFQNGKSALMMLMDVALLPYVLETVSTTSSASNAFHFKSIWLSI